MNRVFTYRRYGNGEVNITDGLVFRELDNLLSVVILPHRVCLCADKVIDDVYLLEVIKDLEVNDLDLDNYLIKLYALGLTHYGQFASIRQAIDAVIQPTITRN